MSTQWRGPGGGLDYSVLRDVMALSGVPQERFLDMFEDIRVMEDAALAQMRKDQREDQAAAARAGMENGGGD